MRGVVQWPDVIPGGPQGLEEPAPDSIPGNPSSVQTWVHFPTRAASPGMTPLIHANPLQTIAMMPLAMCLTRMPSS